LLGARFEVLAIGAPGRDAAKPYPLVDEIIRPVLRVGMPRGPRLNAPGGTMHVVAGWSAQRAEGAVKVFSSLREFKHLEIERCPVPFYGPRVLDPPRLLIYGKWKSEGRWLVRLVAAHSIQDVPHGRGRIRGARSKHSHRKNSPPSGMGLPASTWIRGGQGINPTHSWLCPLVIGQSRLRPQGERSKRVPPEIPKEYGEPASSEAPIRAKWMNHGVTDAPLGAEGVPPRSNATHSLERP
jgi:hypothetical protein